MLLPLLLSLSAQAAAPSAAGQIQISEIMVKPTSTCSRLEWVELTNSTGAALDLDGCEIASRSGSGTSRFTMPVGYPIGAGQSALVIKSDDECGSPICVDAACAGTQWAFPDTDYRLQLYDTSEDYISVTCGGTEIDKVDFLYEGVFDCGTPEDRNCTIQLDPSRLSALDNNDARVVGDWCLPDEADRYTDVFGEDAYGTPGAPNRCGDGVTGGGDGGDGGDGGGDGDSGDVVVVPPDVCRPGDLLISELMPAPKDRGYNDEWIELKGTGNACNLHSCMIEATFLDDEDVEVQKEYQIVASGGVAVLPGGYTVLFGGPSSAEGTAAPVTWTFEDGAQTTSTYNYRQNAVPQRSTFGSIALRCDGALVDSATIQWEEVDSDLTAGCPDGGCSLSLIASRFDDGQNDRPSDWCLSPERTDGRANYADPGDGSTYTVQASPGRENHCPFYSWPGEGDLAFSEVMGNAHSGTPEWFELSNPTGQTLELNLCTLRRAKLDFDGNETTTSTHLFTQGGVIGLAPGTFQVFSKDQCLVPDVVADAEGEVACLYGEILYGSVALTADNDERLQLLCPNETGDLVLVDQIEVNFEGQDAPSGFSLMLDPSKLGEDAATLNDDRAAWCLSGPSQEIPSMRVSDEEGDSCSYGTPGEAGECLVGLVTLPEGPRWLCASSGSGRVGWLLLGLPALVALRRRKAGGVPPG